MIAVSTRPDLSALASKVKTLKDLTTPPSRAASESPIPASATASGHVAALYLAWGDQATDAWLRSLADNNVLLLGGNSVVAEQVAAGTLAAGLTDNDDIAGQKDEHQPIDPVLPDQDAQGTLLIPTTVALVKGATHRNQAEKLIDFLTTARVEKDLIDHHFLAYSARSEGTLPKHLEVDLGQVAHRMHDAVDRSLKILQKR
jgi:iron(III) transport system substrate-binding protein